MHVYLLLYLVPARVIFVEQARGTRDVVAVPIAALVLDFAECVANDLVSPGEDGAIRAQLVEPRPEWPGLWVGDDSLVTLAVSARELLEAHAVNRHVLEPGYGAFDSGDDLGRGLLDLHQEADDAALSPPESEGGSKFRARRA